MSRLKKYLSDTLGIEISIEPMPEDSLKRLPLFLRGLYLLQKAKLLNREVILLNQKDSAPLTARQYLKHVQQIENLYHLPAVLILAPIEAYNRKRLIQKQIAFIIPGKQMFIPQVFIDLKEIRNAILKKKDTLQPAAQCLLFYHILKEDLEKLNFKTIGERIKYSPMTITRAATDLADREICTIEGRKDKRLVFHANKKAIWEKAQPFLQNPIKRKIYIDDQLENVLQYRSGYSALSYYTNIAAHTDNSFAIAQSEYSSLTKNHRITTMNKIEGRFCIEIWKYPPGILAENNIVDPLSLYLSFKEEKDERVETELKRMLEHLW